MLEPAAEAAGSFFTRLSPYLALASLPSTQRAAVGTGFTLCYAFAGRDARRRVHLVNGFGISLSFSLI